MQFNKNKLALKILLLLLPISAFAENKTVGYWNLPEQLNSSNFKISFEVDSTWHLVEGKAKEVSGKIWLNNPADYNSVQGRITIPVISLDTDNSSRDSKMRLVMAEEQHPQIEFDLNSIKNLSNPETLKPQEACSIEINGKLRIKGVEQILNIPAKLLKTESGYQLNAETLIDWSEFGVEDPSILVAKVDKTVKISILVNF